MELLYTGVTKEGLPQTDPTKSLGSFVSSSKIPNGSLDNLFSGVSYYSLLNNQDTFQVIGIVLKNTLGREAIDVNFWFETPVDSLYKYEVAFVTLSLDNLCGYYMERIQNSGSLPYMGTFISIDGEANKGSIGNLASNQMIGIWIKRSVINSNASDLVDCDKLYADWVLNGEKNPSEETEETSFKIEFS